MTYTDTERARAAAWKRATQTLPQSAKLAASYGTRGGVTYDFCLPPEHAHLNLLP